MSPPTPTRWRVVRDVLGQVDRGRDRPRRPDRAAGRGGAGRAVPGDGRHGAGPGADLGPRVGQLPRRVAGGDGRHQRPARPAWRRRRLRGPARPGGPRGRRASLGPDLAPPHPPPPSRPRPPGAPTVDRPATRQRSDPPPAGRLSAERGIDRRSASVHDRVCATVGRGSSRPCWSRRSPPSAWPPPWPSRRRRTTAG